MRAADNREGSFGKPSLIAWLRVAFDFLTGLVTGAVMRTCRMERGTPTGTRSINIGALPNVAVPKKRRVEHAKRGSVERRSVVQKKRGVELGRTEPEGKNPTFLIGDPHG